MPLSDGAIKQEMEEGRLVIVPSPGKEQMQPTSIDLTLANVFLGQDLQQVVSLAGSCSRSVSSLWGSSRAASPLYFSSEVPPPMKAIETDEIVLAPHAFLLGSTRERVKLPDHLVGILEGKSSLGRLGLQVHVTAGYIDPGFEGNITLELKNLGDVYLRLEKGMSICQLRFERVVGKVLRPYGSKGLGSKYQGSEGTIGPRPGMFERER